MADYQLKRAAQRRIDSAPELKAPPSWLEEAVASLRRGIGRAVNEGWGYDIGNIANLLRGLPEVPSSYDRRQGIFHEPEPTTLTEDAVSVVADPTNIIGGAMLKPAARAVRRALPTAATVGSAAYAGDTEAGPLQRLAARLGKEAAPNRRGIANVIKEKGGNWLSGSVEGALSGLKKRMDPELEGYARRGQNLMPHEASDVLPKIAVNNFIDKQLTKYVKNDMATPGDPIRALAERGKLHFEPRDEITEGVLNRAADLRQATGNNITGVATSPLAKSWETSSDSVLEGAKASEWKTNAKPETLARIQGLEKIPDDSFIYEVGSPGLSDNLGFNHLIDELSNAINPDSGLPRHLQFPADRLDRVSVPQAVERVAEINAWRAAQKAEADAMIANNAATVLHKEYPEQGMKWVELKQPEAKSFEDLTPQQQEWYHDYLAEGVSPEGAVRNAAKRGTALADALRYEGDTMGHCVGGYCDDVASGRSRIYSLRDAKGQPHVTIEVGKADPRAIEREMRRVDPQLADDWEERLMSDKPFSSTGHTNQLLEFLEDYDYPELDKFINTQSIKQIKGKGNAKPNDEYLPFVQDFVKSGQWSDVGDLQNTGLIDARAAGKTLPGKPAFMTQDEYKAFQEELGTPPTGFASGGQVKNSLPDFTNPAIINAIFKELQHG